MFLITIPNLNKKLVYAASFSALYLILGYLVTFVTGPSLRGSDAHLIRALLIVVLASRFKTPGSATLMGIISGFILLGIPAPASFLYLPGSILAGLTYDLFMSIGNYSKNSKNKILIILFSIFSGISEAIIVTFGFIMLGFEFYEILARLSIFNMNIGYYGIWLYSIGKNVIMSFIGAIVATVIVSKLHLFSRNK